MNREIHDATAPAVAATEHIEDRASELASEVRWIRRILSALLVILIFYVGVIGAEVIIPVLVSILVSLMLAPAVRAMCKLRIPRSLAAIAVMAATIAVFGALIGSLASPAREWSSRLPKTIDRVEQTVRELRRPFQAATQASQALSELTNSHTDAQPVRVVDGGGPTAFSQAVSATPGVLVSLIATLLLIFVFLLHADSLLRKSVQLAPHWHLKREIVEATRSAQRELSTYIVTIGGINVGVGLLTAAALWCLKIPDPLLWGGVAALFNFAPYVGPMTTVVVLFVVGLSETTTLLAALKVPGVFLLLHVCESMVITPLLVGKRLALDPVVIFLALLVLGSMWGVAGLLMAMPLLACTKIIAERVPQLAALSQMLGV